MTSSVYSSDDIGGSDVGLSRRDEQSGKYELEMCWSAGTNADKKLRGAKETSGKRGQTNMYGLSRTQSDQSTLMAFGTAIAERSRKDSRKISPYVPVKIIDRSVASC
jgi:hypothetical protein